MNNAMTTGIQISGWTPVFSLRKDWNYLGLEFLAQKLKVLFKKPIQPFYEVAGSFCISASSAEGTSVSTSPGVRFCFIISAVGRGGTTSNRNGESRHPVCEWIFAGRNFTWQ